MNYKKIPYLTISFILAGSLLVLLYIYRPDSFSEDSLIENLEGVVLFVSSVVAFLNLNRSTWFRYRTFCVLAGIGSFFICMEEINYGQRLLKIPTPEFFLHYNDQRELNLHNIQNGSMEGCLTLIILLWTCLPFFKNNFQLKNKSVQWIPFFNWEASILSILLFIFNLTCNLMGNHFSESSELLWYCFFLIFLLSNPSKVHAKKRFKNTSFK